MKLVTYTTAGEIRVGVLSGDSLSPLDLPSGEAKRGLAAVIDATLRGESIVDLASAGEILLDDVTVLAPIPRPARNIFCVGKNYADHAREVAGSSLDAGATAGDLPDAPIIFTKVPETVIADRDEIQYVAEISEAIDYEVELAVIIGKPGYRIQGADALDHVWGYTVINDVTARDWQKRHQQWLLGKSFPTFCPMGPVAVTADEIDLGNTVVRSYVNGELRQQGNTSDFIFDVPAVIECISGAMPLVAGDIIATGTPAGVGIGFKPPKYLKDGDRVVVEVDGIGRLDNPVRRIT